MLRRVKSSGKKSFFNIFHMKVVGIIFAFISTVSYALGNFEFYFSQNLRKVAKFIDSRKQSLKKQNLYFIKDHSLKNVK